MKIMVTTFRTTPNPFQHGVFEPIISQKFSQTSDRLLSWAQFCCKTWGGKLGVKPIYYET